MASNISGRSTTKVSIIGAGMVGSTLAYSLAIEGTVGEILLVDVNRERAEGEAMDLNHTLPFMAPTRVWAGDFSDCAKSDVIVITAGFAQKPGESRLHLASRNVAVIKDIANRLKNVVGSAIVIVVANPVDILTYTFIKSSGLTPSQVFGSGTVLDSARLRYELSAHCRVDPRNVHGYIVGEHGDSEVPLWSLTNIAGVKISDYCAICGRECAPDELEAIFENVKKAAYRIIETKGATYYAIGMGTLRLIEAVVRDQRSVYTVSVLLIGQHGLSDVCLSLPCIIGREGIAQVVELPLEDAELQKLHRSARVLREAIAESGA